MKRKFLRITAAIVLALSLLGMSGCTEDKEARRTLDAMFSELKAGDYEGAREYISEREGTNDFLGAMGKYNQEEFPAYEMHNEFFKSIKYTVKHTEKESTVKIKYTVEIDALDLDPVAETLFEISEQYNANIAMENDEIRQEEEGDVEQRTDEEMEEEITKILNQHLVGISRDYINSEDKKNKKTTVDIYACYEEDKVWRIYPDEALVSALTGGVYDKYNEILKEYVEANK